MFKMQAKNNEYQKKNQRYVIDEKRRSLKKNRPYIITYINGFTKIDGQMMTNRGL